MSPCKDLPFDLALPAGAVFTIADAAGVGIECRQGCVWITLDHDTRDIVLEPGERFEHNGHRRALVSVFEPSCITVSCAKPATLPRAAPAQKGVTWWQRHPVATLAATWGALAREAAGRDPVAARAAYPSARV